MNDCAKFPLFDFTRELTVIGRGFVKVFLALARFALLALDQQPVRGRVKNDLHFLATRANIDRSVIESVLQLEETSLVVETEPVLARAKFVILCDLITLFLLSFIP